MNEFLEQFLIEARELVDQATDDLLALEQASDDGARLDSAFRAFHTLKGAAGIVEFAAMGRAVHAAEDLLAAARAGDYPVTADLIGNGLACLDQIVRWLEAMEASGALPTDADAAADRLVADFAATAVTPLAAAAAASVIDGLPPWFEAVRAKISGGAAAVTAVRYAPDANCFYRGEDPVALMAGLPGLIALDLHPREASASLADFDPFACNLILDALSSCSPEEAAAHLRLVRDQVQVYALRRHDSGIGRLDERAIAVLKAQVALISEPVDDRFAGRLGSAGRVAANVLRHFGLTAEAEGIEAARAASLAAADPGAFRAAVETVLSDQTGSAEPKAAQGPTLAVPETIARALRIDVERIDAIVKLTGELTVVKNALGHSVRLASQGGDPKGLAQTLKQQHALLDRLTAELQRSVLAVRVLPLGYIFRRFPRLVREIGQSLGKNVRLVTAGDATEADKAVVEALFEPLLHVLRNAVDHGVESPSRRAAAGKPEAATIRLDGRREGEHVIVDVVDDGSGIDPVEMRRVAAERNLVTSEALAALTDDEAVNLIFTPGFSTASVVTSLSGRGVGMDAIRAAIERLGGRVTVSSRVAAGTTVRFTLPFTVMMTRVMTVEAAGQVFGVPFEAVVETVQLERGRISPIGAAAAFVLHGRTVPLVSLARALDLDADGVLPPLANAVVIEVGGQLSALEVDRFGERLDVMLKPMDGLLAGMAGVAGTTLLGDGRVLIVLDLQELLQ